MKNKWLAAALNLIPGIGYIYIGGTRLVFGVMLLIFWLVNILAGLYGPAVVDNTPSSIWDILIPLALVSAFVVDAYLEAKRYNEKTKQA